MSRYVPIPGAEIEAALKMLAFQRGHGFDEAVIFVISTGLRRLRALRKNTTRRQEQP